MFKMAFFLWILIIEGLIVLGLLSPLFVLLGVICQVLAAIYDRIEQKREEKNHEK